MSDAEQKKLDSVLEQLSKEIAQEQEVTSGASYLADINEARFRQREPEYRDIEKHFVRWKWLTQAKDVAAKNGRPVRYLTLPAYYRLDVALLDRDNVLDATAEAGQRILEVAAFEAEPTKYARMAGHVPKLRLFGSTEIEAALLDPANAYYQELADLFPFDVVNLDLTTSLTPKHEGPYSRIMQAIEEVMTRQGSHGGTWALFLTFRNVKDEWEPEALAQFIGNLQGNLDQYPKIRDAFVSKYQKTSVGALLTSDARIAISQAVTKWMVDRAHGHQLRVNAMKSYYYVKSPEGEPSYTITKLIFNFSKGQLSKAQIPMKGIPPQGWMEDELIQCVQNHSFTDVQKSIESLPATKVQKLQSEIADLSKGIE